MPVSSNPAKLALINERRAQRSAAVEQQLERLEDLLKTKHRLRQEVQRVMALEANQAAARAELQRQAKSESAYATARRTAEAEVENIRRAVAYNLDFRVMPLLELWQRDPDQGKPGPHHPRRVFALGGAQYG
jgi:hypothetical protein